MRREHRDLAYIRRWSIMRLQHQQNVAEHCFYVALYTHDLAMILGLSTQEVLNVVYVALWHDIEEVWTGDIPGPAKRLFVKDADAHIDAHFKERFGFDRPKPLNEQHRVILKVAGLIDECMFLAGEMQTGNQAVRHVFDKTSRRLQTAMGLLFDRKKPGHIRAMDAIWNAIEAERSEGSGILQDNDSDLKG
jgi:5'-deoxynucleotidase YfbR-like HD superfamily hydrolase